MAKAVDKIRELSKQAAAKEIAERQAKVEESVNQDIAVIEKILAMVKDRLVYKETKAPHSNRRIYIVVTEDVVLQDYSNKPEYGSGTSIKQVEGSYYSHSHTVITVNGHKYYHAKDLIEKYKFDASMAFETLQVEYDAARDRKERLESMTDLEPVMKELMLNYHKHLDMDTAN